MAFFEILDKDEDNSSLGYHCGVKFQDDKIRHVLNMRVSSNDAEIINKCAKMRVKTKHKGVREKKKRSGARVRIKNRVARTP